MHPTIQLLAIGLIAGLAIGIAIHLVLSRTTKARIRAQGYSAGSQARQPVIDELQHSVNEQALEITRLKGQRQNLASNHRIALDSITQDADARVKLFAQRCLSDHELLWVRRAIKQLERATETHTLLGNSQRARDTSATREQLQALVSRLQQQEPAQDAPVSNVATAEVPA